MRDPGGCRGAWRRCRSERRRCLSARRCLTAPRRWRAAARRVATTMAAMLEGMVDKVVQVVTNDGRNIVGLLKGFDQTTNVILDECHERVFSAAAGVEQVCTPHCSSRTPRRTQRLALAAWLAGGARSLHRARRQHVRERAKNPPGAPIANAAARLLQAMPSSDAPSRSPSCAAPSWARSTRRWMQSLHSMRSSPSLSNLSCTSRVRAVPIPPPQHSVRSCTLHLRRVALNVNFSFWAEPNID